MQGVAATAERVIRRIAAVIIALFLLAFAAFVFLSLFDDPARLLRFLREAVATPGFWLVLLGPVGFWISVMIVALRLPRKARSMDMGALGRRLHLGNLLEAFRQYRRHFGFDLVLWSVVISGTLSTLLLWLAAAGARQSMTAWLIFMTLLWSSFATWLLFFSRPRASGEG